MNSSRPIGWETLKEACYRLHVSACTVIKWANNGQIPRLRINARVVFYDLRNPPTWQFGHPKLTSLQVEAIRELRSLGASSLILAHHYRVNDSTIRDVCLRDRRRLSPPGPPRP